MMMNGYAASIAAQNARSNAEIEKMVTEHAQLVKKLAYHLACRIPPNIDVNDLIQVGMIALFECAQKWDASLGAKFETYATIRINGAMIDELRRSDWTPRRLNKALKNIQEASRKIENANGRRASSNEIADEMGIDINEYHGILNDASQSDILSLDELFESGYEGSLANESTIEKGAEREEIYKLVTGAIEGLNEKEKIILSLFYQEGLNQKEIAAVMGVTEARISQAKSKALLYIRDKIRRETGD